MKAATLAVLVALASAASARAQPAWVGEADDGGLPPRAVMRIVRASGLAPVSRPVRIGPHYVLHAATRSGDLVRVFVDAQLGEVVRVARPSHVAEPYEPPPRRWNAPPRRTYDHDDTPAPRRGARILSDEPGYWDDEPPPRPRAVFPEEELDDAPRAYSRGRADLPRPQNDAGSPGRVRSEELPPLYASPPAETRLPRARPGEPAAASLPPAAAGHDGKATPPPAAKDEKAAPASQEAAKPAVKAGYAAAPPPDAARQAAKPAEAAPPKQAAAPQAAAPPAAAPRVILPGGPMPKADAAAAPPLSVKNAAPAPNPSGVAASSGTPVNPLE